MITVTVEVNEGPLDVSIPDGFVLAKDENGLTITAAPLLESPEAMHEGNPLSPKHGARLATIEREKTDPFVEAIDLPPVPDGVTPYTTHPIESPKPDEPTEPTEATPHIYGPDVTESSLVVPEPAPEPEVYEEPKVIESSKDWENK